MKNSLDNMDNLIIVLNGPASQRNGFIIIETYNTKNILINKFGVYKGGSISSINIYEQHITIQNVDILKIRQCFESCTEQLSHCAFYVKPDEIHNFFSSILGYKILFLDNYDNTLFWMKEICNCSQIKKAKRKYSVANKFLYYYADNSFSLETHFGDKNFNIKLIKPTPQLTYDDQEQLYFLFFNYKGVEVNFSDKRVAIHNDKNIFLRNYSEENAIVQFLLKEHFIKLAQNRFIYSGPFNFPQLRDKLLHFGIEFHSRDDDAILPHVKISKLNNDWFEVDLTYPISNEIINLASYIDLSQSKNRLQIKNQKIVIPFSIAQHQDCIVKERNKLMINRKNLFCLLRIASECECETNEFLGLQKVSLQIPNKFFQAAYHYQLDGIKWLKFLLQNGFGGCLADDMGLGKTFQTIAFLEDEEVKRNISKVLIIVPRSLLTNWVKELIKFSSSYQSIIYHGNNRHNITLNNYNMIITTYNTAFADIEQLREISFSLIVFDEIQVIKNYKSIVSSTLRQLKSFVRIGLSGTPMENNIGELWNIMDILNPNLFPRRSLFLQRYSQKNHSELKNILTPFILRRVKEDVLKDLPPKREQIIYCDMSTEQRQLYMGLNLSIKHAIMSMKAFAAPVVLKGLTLLRECCCHPTLLPPTVNVNNVQASCKLEALKILVNNLIEANHKILIFSNYTSMLKIIQSELIKDMKYQNQIFYLDGNTRDRACLIDEFQKSKSGIFLISIKAGGVGLNLTSAQDVIIYDPWWNPFVEKQAMDRAHRIGQNKMVSVYKMVVADTLEEKIVSLQKDKQENFDDILNGISNEKNLSLEAIMKLLN